MGASMATFSLSSMGSTGPKCKCKCKTVEDDWWVRGRDLRCRVHVQVAADAGMSCRGCKVVGGVKIYGVAGGGGSETCQKCQC